jgi:hypothetical protein
VVQGENEKENELRKRGRMGIGGAFGAKAAANKFAPVRAGCFVGELHEVLVAVFYPHAQGKSG